MAGENNACEHCLLTACLLQNMSEHIPLRNEPRFSKFQKFFFKSMFFTHYRLIYILHTPCLTRLLKMSFYAAMMRMEIR